MFDIVLYVVFPYVAVFLAVFGSIVRYITNRYSYSSLSSELIEHRTLFWGTINWHYGVVPILLIHLGGFAIPGVMAMLHNTLTSLYLAELAGKVMALMALIGITILIIRRLANLGIRLNTTPMDWVVLVLLFIQISLGLWTSVFYRWGAIWFLRTVTPWVVSLAIFQPEVQSITILPLVTKLHLLNATLLIAIFPFSRLVHMVTYPVEYLWRRYQVVIWNRHMAH